MKHRTFNFVIILLVLPTSFLFLIAAIKHEPIELLKVGYGVSTTKRIIYVPDDFEKIQSALDNASDGDFILVRPGTYKENIVINKSVFLIGVNKNTTILDGERKSDVVIVDADNVVLTGFTIKNGDFSAQSVLPLGPPSGIKIQHRVNVLVHHNLVVNNFVGIRIYRAASNTVKWNYISNNRYGVFLAHSKGNRVYANNISANKWNGIELDWSDENRVEANTVSHNKAYGLEIPPETPAQRNIVFRNNFFNNTLGVRASSSMNSWSGGYPVGGNFWDFNIGVDEFHGLNQDQLGSDGIIDTPFAFDKENVDPYPLAALFKPSPVASPKANFSFSPQRPFVGDVVAFDASKSASEEETFSYFWNFGDGARSQGANATHVYTSCGGFFVDLYVIDNKEGLSATESKLVIIEAPSGNFLAYVVIGVVTIAIIATIAYFTKIKKQTRNPHLQKEIGAKFMLRSALNCKKMPLKERNKYLLKLHF